MRNHSLRAGLLAAFALISGLTARADSQTGLWVGEVVLTRVNETVVGINAQNQIVAPDPTNATPVQTPAHLRIIVHVDDSGQARLLKNVAILDKSTNNTADLSLITDESLYPNFPGTGRRITAAAFDFGDSAANDLLKRIATAAANAAAVGGNATNAATSLAAKADVEAKYQSFAGGAALRNAALKCAADAANGAVVARNAMSTAGQIGVAATNGAATSPAISTNRTYATTLQNAALFPDTRYVAAVDGIIGAAADAAALAANSNLLSEVIGENATNAVLLALTNALNATPIVSPGYLTFLGTTSFGNAANVAAAGATAAAKKAMLASQFQSAVLNQAQAGALKALTDAGIFTAADKVVNRELLLTGSVAAGENLSGSLFLGANHPTNPFLHRRHAEHRSGYNITRAIAIRFYPADSPQAVRNVSFGVDRIAGTYREEIGGLHKPLGPNQDIGLITEGTVTLNRVSTVGTLNQ